MILIRVNYAFFFQFSDLGGKTASVDLKIIGELLAVKGNVKAVAVDLFRLHQEISHKLLAR